MMKEIVIKNEGFERLMHLKTIPETQSKGFNACHKLSRKQRNTTINTQLSLR